jgi:hypothetical protein
MFYQKFLIAAAAALIYSTTLTVFGIMLSGRESLLDTLLGVTLTVMYSMAGTILYGFPVSLIAASLSGLTLFKEKMACQLVVSAVIYAGFSLLFYYIVQDGPLLWKSAFTCSFLMFILDVLFDSSKRRWIVSGFSGKK